MRILLIDDERDFADGRGCVIARSSSSAIAVFVDTPGVEFDEVWCDFSLKRSDTIMDFLFFARTMAKEGTPLNVKKFIAHSSNYDGRELVKEMLSTSGYHVSELVNPDLIFVSPHTH